jgi:Signal transduction histidine kinase
MKRSISLVLLIFLCLIQAVHAQTGTFYSPDRDLSNSLINTIYQDRRNYIWIATEDGLNKFDGVRFTIYKNRPGDSTSLKNNYVITMYEDSKGRFWVGCINGLLRYDRATDSFRDVAVYDGKQRVYSPIYSIIEKPDGEIWVATSRNGIVRIPKGNGSVQADRKLSAQLSSKFLVAMYQDSRKDMWIATDYRGVNRYSAKTGKVTQYKSPGEIGSNQISAICESSRGEIFVGTLSKGLFRFNPATNKFDAVPYKSGSGALPVKSLIVDKQKRLLVGTDGNGIKIYNEKEGCLEDFRIPWAPFDFSRMKVHAILQDKDGNLWTGIFQKGVFLSPNNPNKFNYLGFKSFAGNKIGSGCVMSVLKGRDNTLWIGTDNDGLYSIAPDGSSNHYSPGNNGKSVPGTIMSIVEGEDGMLWLGSYFDGFSRFDKRTGVCTYYDYSLENEVGNTFRNKVDCIARDPQNRLWIGTNGAGVYVFDPVTSKYTAHYSLSAPKGFRLHSEWVNTILCDRDGITWVGTYDGFCSIDPRKGKISVFNMENKALPGNTVYSIIGDRKGNLWVGTSEGLACFNKKTHTSRFYTTKDGLADNVICGILEDETGNIWISTHGGISKLIVSQNKFVNHYAFDGLQGNEFSKGAAFRALSGEMFFGGISGVTSFFPKEIKDKRTPLHLFLTGLYIMDRRVVQGQTSGRHQIIDGFISDVNTIRLSYKDNMFALEFSTFDFSNSRHVYYRYFMEGVSSQWMTTEKGVNRINFTNIDYGSYKLRVKACIHDTMSEEKIFYILISPPWYLSWWAKAIYFILFLLLMWGIAQYILNKIRYRQEIMRVEHAEQISEAKLQFFINISHEIRTPMTLIMSPLEKLIKENADPENQKVYQMMFRNSQRILRLINQLMDIRKIDKGQMTVKLRESDLVGFIDDLMQTFEYQANKRNIRFAFIHNDPQLNVWIDLNNFDKILVNLLSNAFKFTPDNGEITISLQRGVDENVSGPLREYCEIVVGDTGIGIETNKIEKIFERFYQIDNDQSKVNFGTGIGLHLAKSLIELLHGQLFARNKEVGQGSEFIIRLPLGGAHLTADEIGTNGHELPAKSTHEDVETEPKKQSLVKEKLPKARTNYRVLVVDDEDEIRHYLSRELSVYYHVSECRNGKEALDFILKEKPHLVISDVMMPEMDGITLCKKLKSNININHIPIILLTAKTGDDHVAEGLDTGADAYVVKPFNIELLNKQVANLIENRERLELKPVDAEQNKSLIKPVVLRPHDQVLLEKIMKIINDNIANPELNVETLAVGTGMSRVHMHRKLKELTNQSARDLIRTIRLQQAGEILKSQKQSISDVAYALGFSNLSHFSNSFREFYGMSPKEYAEKNRSDR